MLDPFSLGVCAIKTVAAAASLLAAADKGVSAEAAANAIEALMKGGEAAGDFRDQGSHEFANALRGAAKKLEARYEELLKQGHSREYRESVEVAFANVAEVSARCLPAPEALARMNHDPQTIAVAVVDAAIERSMDVFADPSGEARNILVLLVSTTYSALRADPKFMDPLQGVNWAENFARLERVESKVDRSTAAIEALRLEIAREKGVPPDVLKPLFDHLGMGSLSVLQMRERAEEAITAILAKANERVAPSNLGADIDAIIAAARAKLADLDTAGAETILDDQIAEGDAAFRRRQVPLLAEKAAVQRLTYNHEGAKLTLRRLLDLDPDQVWRWIDSGDICRTTGSLAEALSHFRSAAEAARRSGNDRDLSVSYERIGDVLVRQGNLPEALKSYSAGLAIAERLARTDAGNSDWQRDLSFSNINIGDVLVRQGNLPEALKSYSAGLAIAERLARTDAGNSDWQRDLSVSNNKIGDVLVSQGNLPEALKSYSAGLAIRERLARTDAGNADWQRDLSVSNNKIGDVLVSQGNLPEALKSYSAGLAIRERLARTDAGNADWQRDLSVSNNKIGDVLVSQGNLPEALKSYQAGLAIAERLARMDAGNADWQRDLSVSNIKIGDVLVSQGNLPEALKSYQAGLAIAERLARTDAGNADWQRDLSVSYDRIGDVWVRQGNLPEALKSYQAGLAIAERLARTDAGNAQWQFDLGISNERVGNVQVALGDLAGALKSYRTKFAIIDRLARADPGNADWQRDLSVSNNKIGDVLVRQGNLTEALNSYQAGLAIRERLARTDAGNAEWQRDLIVSCVKISETFPAEARAMLTRASAIANRLRDEGRLAPADAWMPDELARLLAALP